jgi:DNA repair protein RecO (recombination protein O)
MSVLTSEAVVLRTWPVHEADLIVSFFTRDYGRVKGVAKSALKSRKRFGGALEPMTVARAWFAERPRQELVRLDQLEIVRSPLSAPVDHARMAVLSFFAEVLDEALPEHDPQETVFRLLLAVLEQTTVEQPWMPLTYFSLWMTRLMGLLPDIAHCTACGEALARPERPASTPSATGCSAPCIAAETRAGSRRTPGNWRSGCCGRRPRPLPGESWPRRRGQDLRRFTCSPWSGTWSANCARPRRWAAGRLTVHARWLVKLAQSSAGKIAVVPSRESFECLHPQLSSSAVVR